MLRRSRRASSSATPPGFDDTVELVESAKAALVAVVPAGRAPGLPLSDSLLAFHERLEEARTSMRSWRSAATEPVWRRCEAAVTESLRRAERLRLEAPDLDYEGLVMTLAAIIEPLEALAEADEALRGS